jgi:hypothetical protein
MVARGTYIDLAGNGDKRHQGGVKICGTTSPNSATFSRHRLYEEFRICFLGLLMKVQDFIKSFNCYDRR